jgi:type II secretory pathway pseudopilin PulG
VSTLSTVVQAFGRNERGFTYLGLLFFLAIAGLALASVGVVWHTANLREKERELLFVGAQFRSAILQYHASSPGARRYPAQLEELLQDNRYPNVRRYLRRVYRDPLTGNTEWGLVKAPDGGILGVYSLAPGQPFKSGGFSTTEAGFEDAESYADWKFVAVVPGSPQTASAVPATPGAVPPTPLTVPAGMNAPAAPMQAELDELDQEHACALARAVDRQECQQAAPEQRAACVRSADDRARACAQGLPLPPLAVSP